MGKTFSGGRIDGGCPDDTRVPLPRVELCDEADGSTDGLGVEPEDWRVLLLPAAAPGGAREPAGSSEVIDPSSGDVGPTPDIRSKVTERFVATAGSGPGLESTRTFLSTEESVGVEAVELGFRFRADRGSKGGTKAVTEPVPLAVVATSAEVLVGGSGGFFGVVETTAGNLEREGTSNSSKW
jgi:hypothetical protein